jgi:hypothetical protein
MNIFVNRNAEVVVTLFVCSDEKQKGFWTKNNQKNKPENIDEKTEGVKSYNLVFRLPNYKDSVELMDTGIQFSMEGGMQISTGAVSFGRFSKLLKSWDFKDSEGNNIPASPENIAWLEPGIAKCIVEDLESQIFS